ncbi:anthranilate synthase component 1 [Chromobacterium alkanivorans]|uniref:anthranilate synthase component I family protein n=1 Tax=Chromobacterium alkanivorans TaxID=1071719 RepID=UPI00216A0F13|nr:anthranilate synthase component I family protein [Chromobacterium alkanivorans]MCS3805728.1 anthranilate synthase component 1 [Chromobacterium alkanivorans]MCS3820042.1 anthranilate synthase component 1 [Chromobacterium alkanivorans]MCS3874799.1 anthranilate synthase component 1 [Chromobacterium alkanivorans]
MLSEEAFLRYGDHGFSLAPLWQTLPLPAGTDPLVLYQALANQGGDYLFETGHWRDGEFQRAYSVIGLPCRERVELDEGRLRHWRDGQLLRELECEDPMAELARLRQGWSAPHFSALPPFSGGLFGYFGFETTRLIEPRLRRQPRKPSGLALPDALQWLSLDLLVLDHQQASVYCIVHESTEATAAYARGQRRLRELCERTRALLAEPPEPPPAFAADAAADPALNHAFSREDFQRAVGRIKDYIAAGDVMQVVLSQRMSQPFAADAPTLYRALSGLGDTPYRYLLNLGDAQIVGASPEMLFRQQDERVTSRPMAGTRRRGADAAEDQDLRRELLADPKEIAEHMMLVDLARNDLGRLAELGSVQVDELLTVENFSHVMHIVSTVSGKLPQQAQALDVLKSTFPAGTLSGASKVRALEVIAELEPHSRGVYGGSIGYIGWRGNADQAITIRTGVLQGGQLHVQAGAGVVQDSLAEREWQETLEKSRLMLLAAKLAAAARQEEAACI